MEREVRLEQWLLGIWKPLAMLILMVAALVLTHSRGGFMATARRRAGAAAGHQLPPAASRHSRARLALLAALVAVSAFVLAHQ